MSPISSCRPSRVPRYFEMMCSKNAGARLARLANVVARVTAQAGERISSRRIEIGRGVVATIACGRRSMRRPIIAMSGVGTLDRIGSGGALDFGPRGQLVGEDAVVLRAAQAVG